MMRPYRVPLSFILCLLLLAGTVLIVGCNEATQSAPSTQTASETVSSSPSESAETAEPAESEEAGPPEPAEVDRPVLSPGTFSREQLIEDARQLLEILEENHPDPYIHGGGKVAFHLRFQRLLKSIPETGMTQEGFARLLTPFLASIGDGHTDIFGSYPLNPSAPGGIPLRFQIVEQSLYVASVASASARNLIGSVLVSVEGVPVEELRARQAQIRAIENEYHDLLWLIDGLWYRAYLEDLLPEWTPGQPIRVVLETVTGEIVERTLRTNFYGTPLHGPDTRYPTVDPGPYGFAYSVDTQSPSVAILRVDDMTDYREVLGRTGGLTREDFTEERIAATPSATETFRQLVIDMKAAGTETLLIDLRNNPGGASIMGDFLIYFLYGKDLMFDAFAYSILHEGGQIERIGPLERVYYTDEELDDVSSMMGFPLETGDFKTIDHYDFFLDYSEASGLTLEEIEVIERERFRDGAFSDFPLFFEEYSSGEHEAYYTPENIVVLVRPRTFSSGFAMMKSLDVAGATLIGTPSAQSANVFGEGMIWKLNHSGVEGIVSHNVIVGSADDPERGRVWPVDIQMTYQDLAEHDFDPNTEILMALEWIDAERARREAEAVARLETELAEIREALRIPGMSAAVVRDGETLWADGFGLADVEDSIPATPDTPYGLASVTKPFAAVLLMKKVEEGLLDLDTPAIDFGIDLNYDAITVRQLFTHTSGGVPGSRFQYDGNRYSMLTDVIEQLYGDSFRSVLRSEILAPLGMEDTALNYGGCGLSYYLSTLGAEDPERAFERIYHEAATPYRYDGFYDAHPGNVPSYANAAAGLISTANDLAKFATAVERDLLVSSETSAAMFTPTILNSGDESPYGLGWFIEEYEGTELIWHYGYGAYSSLLLMVPSQKLTFIALANSQNLSRPFGLGHAEVSVLSSPVGLSFYKAFVAQEAHDDVLPTIDWSVGEDELIAALEDITDEDLRRLYERELWTYRKLFAGVGEKDVSTRLFQIHRKVFPEFEYSMLDRYEVGRPSPRSSQRAQAVLSAEDIARWVGRYVLDPEETPTGLPEQIEVFAVEGALIMVPSNDECQRFEAAGPGSVCSVDNADIRLVAQEETGPIRTILVELQGEAIGRYSRSD